MSQTTERTGFALVLGTVLLAPWLFGGAEPWSMLLLSALILVGGLLNTIGRGSFAYDPGGLGAVLPFFGFVLLQLLPLPLALVNRLNPTLAACRARQFDLRQASWADFTLSCSPEATWAALYPLAIAAVSFLVAARMYDRRTRLLTSAAAITINGFALSVFAIAQRVVGSEQIYGTYIPASGGTAFGPFPNRNHFGTWMNLCLGIAAGLFFYLAFSRKSADHTEHRRKLDARILLLFMIIVMVAAVLLSQSRGAAVCAFAGLGCATVLVFTRFRRLRRRLAVLLSLLIAVVALCVWLDLPTAVSRIRTMSNGNPFDVARYETARVTLRMARDSWLVGWGAGAFQHAFPLYQPRKLNFGRFCCAHNDYIQLFSEVGAVGMLTLVWPLIAALRHLRSRLRALSTRRWALVVFLLGGGGAVALQALVDFGLRRPANSLLAGWVAGMLAALTWDPDVGPTPASASRRWSLLAVHALLLTLLARLPFLLQGEVCYRLWRQGAQVAQKGPSNEAREWGSWDAVQQATATLANPVRIEALLDICEQHLRLLGQPWVSFETRILLAELADAAAERAIRIAPTDYEPWLWRARMLALRGDEQEAKSYLLEAARLAPAGLELVMYGPGHGRIAVPSVAQ